MASDRARSGLMARVRSEGTAPEIAVRSALHAHGFRFRLHRRDLPGRPDLVLPRHKTAVFVHGCFWHGCAVCDRGLRRPKQNADFWTTKLAANIERDSRVKAELEQKGWRVEIVWECETRDPNRLRAAIAHLTDKLGKARQRDID